MEYSLLGPTGVKLSKICLGTATFGVAPDAQESDVKWHGNGRAASASGRPRVSSLRSGPRRFVLDLNW
jgi:hypothetical protein